MAGFILVCGIRVARDFNKESFSRLTTAGPRFRIGKNTYQVCQCECGNHAVVKSQNMKKGYKKSCGCLQKTCFGSSNKNSDSYQAYVIWRAMRKRCNWSGCKDYSAYGGRGIKVCQRWSVFENFLTDMGNRPSRKHSIDRVDNDGDYCPENCRWATNVEQANNRSNNVLLTAFGRTKSISSWAVEFNMNYFALHGRLKRGWELEKALITPIRKIRNGRKPAN